MKKKMLMMVIALSLILGILAGCHSEDSGEDLTDIYSPEGIGLNVGDIMDIALEMPPLTASPAMFSIPVPSASGTLVKKNAKAEIDYSNTTDGYVMVRFLQQTSKQLRVQVTGPDDVTYTYTLKQDGTFEVFPLSGGNGSYKINVFEQIDGNRYAIANSVTTTVSLKDEFAPFLRTNQYVNFKPESKTVAKAAELVSGSNDFFGKLAAVYNFVINNITYDVELAKTVQSGYLPNLDSILERRKGICFDYAALMTAMLRSQGIPTKLVVGYAGTAYHAWINVYSEETGWISNVILFDGSTWTLMDPTFAASRSAEALRFIGDGSNYRVKFLY